ncbi:WXG100 family type VII secretion target [Nocardia sp. CDC159]|uniref:ESAT-6-like protein n=1 Tax=Nocardia pulmonis TaxID=2951408 RepID=A0A9X2J0N0_9NOCA|nr:MULTISPECIES: WXG100 family type VII secretion target [Nocardia]MCM6776096.1 WXG100 family type VII secretion target [Nocardia pulmonis]MCM6788577.1 WXG100 family type VII secretion target [Nocardia sp. CDC159]
MTSAVGVNTGGIDGVVKEMESAINNLRASVNAVDAAADEVRAGWKGQANDTFMQVSKSWSDEAERLNKKLDELQAAVDQGKNTLVNMDQGSFNGNSVAAASGPRSTNLPM